MIDKKMTAADLHQRAEPGPFLRERALRELAPNPLEADLTVARFERDQALDTVRNLQIELAAEKLSCRHWARVSKFVTLLLAAATLQVVWAHLMLWWR